ncbi:ethanolamine utilization protein, partial [Pyrenophora tritici-repentis]
TGIFKEQEWLILSDMIVSNTTLVPLTIIKGAGHEHIALPEGDNATVADFHTTLTQTPTTTPTPITSGFYKITAGPSKPAAYTFEESKYVLSGQIDVLDEATGITHHLVAGDFAFFHVGSKVQFSTRSVGMAFYVVTRPVRVEHGGLVGRAEGEKARL